MTFGDSEYLEMAPAIPTLRNSRLFSSFETDSPLRVLKYPTQTTNLHSIASQLEIRHSHAARVREMNSRNLVPDTVNPQALQLQRTNFEAADG
jgi:hypothetical protein